MDEIITWRDSNNERPTNDELMLIFRLGSVSVGYWDREDETWRLGESGMRVGFVENWAAMPEGPVEQ
jgi:hypothetical protein